jgi:methylenetetrahydrofolate dehydrogenase (NADP+)/methenyltetrahydrofolate cyclohydrolase
MRALDPNKDVDGFHPLNVGRLFEGQSDGFFPCTPLGIRTLLERSGVETAGKHALVIGRSNIVGKPMAAMLLQNSIGGNATVTVAHSYSRNIKELGRMADILIAAIGKPRFVTADMIKEGAVIIDVGTNKIANPAKAGGYQIVGDVDFENVKEKCSLITPVPGGVGPMTIAMLLSNTVRSFQRRRG